MGLACVCVGFGLAETECIVLKTAGVAVCFLLPSTDLLEVLDGAIDDLLGVCSCLMRDGASP